MNESKSAAQIFKKNLDNLKLSIWSKIAIFLVLIFSFVSVINFVGNNISSNIAKPKVESANENKVESKKISTQQELNITSPTISNVLSKEELEKLDTKPKDILSNISNIKVQPDELNTINSKQDSLEKEKRKEALSYIIVVFDQNTAYFYNNNKIDVSLFRFSVNCNIYKYKCKYWKFFAPTLRLPVGKIIQLKLDNLVDYETETIRFNTEIDLVNDYDIGVSGDVDGVPTQFDGFFKANTVE